MEKSRPCFKKKSINLYNLMKKIWPCNNIYTAVCKDAAYGFQWGLSQEMKIGKSRDPTNISEMTCEDIDDTQVSALRKEIELGSSFDVDKIKFDSKYNWPLARACTELMNITVFLEIRFQISFFSSLNFILERKRAPSYKIFRKECTGRTI